MNKHNKFPRTMNEAFGPYARLKTEKPRSSNGDIFLAVFFIFVVLALIFGSIEELTR